MSGQRQKNILFTVMKVPKCNNETVLTGTCKVNAKLNLLVISGEKDDGKYQLSRLRR